MEFAIKLPYLPLRPVTQKYLYHLSTWMVTYMLAWYLIVNNDFFPFSQMEKQSASQDTSKKKSRKQRRKLRNLRDDNTCKQRKNSWLETHIWHAKRMHMMDYYGYRVAERANDKGVRQAYRSLRHGCLLSVSLGLKYTVLSQALISS